MHSSVSQLIFAFQWEDPQLGRQQQLTWTWLSQGFKNSPTIFGTALASDLRAHPAEEAGYTLLQYVDTSSLQQLTTKTVLKGQSSYSISYGKLDIRYFKRRPRSVKTKSNIWSFTSPKASGILAHKENKLSVQS
jgi:hypothetical protein